MNQVEVGASPSVSPLGDIVFFLSFGTAYFREGAGEGAWWGGPERVGNRLWW
jgi:hypothetical protein